MAIGTRVLKLYNGVEGKPGLMTSDELCAYLNVKRAFIYQMTHEKRIPHLKIGGTLRFRKSDIDGWLASQEVRVGGNKTGKQKRGSLVRRHLP